MTSQTAANVAMRASRDANISIGARTSARTDAVSTPARGPVTVEILSVEPRLTAYRQAWEALYDSSSCEPSTSFEWSDAMTRSHVETSDSFFLLGVSRGSELIGLVPLVSRRLSIFGVPVSLLTPLAERYNTHSDLLIRDLDDNIAAAFLKAVLALPVRWDLFRMVNVLDGHPLVRVASWKGLRANRHLRNGHGSYFLELPRSYTDYLDRRSAKFRNHLKRTEKKLGDHGAIGIDVITEAADVPAAYESLLHIERASWKHGHGTAISAVPRQIQFYRELCDGAAKRGRLHLQVLTLDGEPVAYNLGYVRNGWYSYLKTSFAERTKAIGAATYLRARLIESLIADGIRVLDFPAEPYEWERQWTETVRWHKVLTVYKSTPAGLALSCIDKWRDRGDHSRQIEHVDPRRMAPPSTASTVVAPASGESR